MLNTPSKPAEISISTGILTLKKADFWENKKIKKLKNLGMIIENVGENLISRGILA